MDPLTERIIGCAIEVHRNLGPGLLESTYSACLAYELSKAGLSFQLEASMPVRYKEIRLDCGYRLDFLVENQVVLELKAVDEILAIHKAQLLTYLRLMQLRTGLLLNFNVTLLRNGLLRMSN